MVHHTSCRLHSRLPAAAPPSAFPAAAPGLLLTSACGSTAEDDSAWDRHIDVLASTSAALQEQDGAAQQAARSAYDTAEQELAAVLSALVGGTARGPT